MDGKAPVSFAPTCSRENWLKRQSLMNKVREFFTARGSLEVETPTLSNAGGTDPQLDYFRWVPLVSLCVS